MKRKIFIGCGVILLSLSTIALWNYFSLYRPVTQSLSSDPRNEGVDVYVHYRWYINPNALVFDLRSFSQNNSSVDVTRNLLQTANALEKKSFDQVFLAYKGKPKFMLEGKYFKNVGEEYEFQNPVYTLRTLPENVLELDGTPAFGSWTGGWLGIMSKQMEDLGKFHKRWFLSDLL